MLYKSGFTGKPSRFARRSAKHKSLMMGLICGLMGLTMAHGHGIDNPQLFDSVLNYRQGNLRLDHHVQVKTGTQLRFLNGQDANHVIYDVWGGAADPSIVGMLLPANISPVSEGGWGLSLQYLDTGYVDARRWKNLDAQTLLKTMQQQQTPYTLLNWAIPPSFDGKKGILMFATEVKLPQAEDTAVLPTVVVLGREGLLLMKGVMEKKHWSGMPDILQQVAAAVQFQPGFQYRDVQAGDRLYDYGMASLITGQPMDDPTTREAPQLFPVLAMVVGMGLMGVWLGRGLRSRSLKATTHFQRDGV